MYLERWHEPLTIGAKHLIGSHPLPGSGYKAVGVTDDVRIHIQVDGREYPLDTLECERFSTLSFHDDCHATPCPLWLLGSSSR